MKANVAMYWKFGAMIVTSMVEMFAITCLNSYDADQVRLCETCFYTTFVMGAAMAVVMLMFMLKMFSSSRANAGILTAGVMVYGVAPGRCEARRPLAPVPA